MKTCRHNAGNRRLDDHRMDRKVLFLSPTLELQGGNLVTLTRISTHLHSHGYTSELSSPSSFSDRDEFTRKVKAENIQMAVGIHAYKTGLFMKASGLPYIVIIGGTDVHAFADDPHKLRDMAKVVRNARCVVCFSHELKTRVFELWPWLCETRVRVVPQGIEIHPVVGPASPDMSEGEDIKQHLVRVMTNQTLPAAFLSSTVNPIVFVFVGGIRPVKDPLYLIKLFQDWHARDERIWFLVVGQVLDQCYTENQFLPAAQSHPGVMFIPGVPLADCHAIVRKSFALVNSSENEGMCLAILEAMALGVPVLARDNLGNRSIVEDGHTGLIFTSHQSFLLKAEWLVNHPKERAKVIANAKDFVTSNHSTAFESAAYLDMIRQCLADKPSSTTLPHPPLIIPSDKSTMSK